MINDSFIPPNRSHIMTNDTDGKLIQRMVTTNNSPPLMPKRKESITIVPSSFALDGRQFDEEGGTSDQRISPILQTTLSEKKHKKRIRIASIVYDEPIPRPPSMPVRRKSNEQIEQVDSTLSTLKSGYLATPSRDAFIDDWLRGGSYDNSADVINSDTSSRSFSSWTSATSSSSSMGFMFSESPLCIRGRKEKKTLVGILKNSRRGRKRNEG